MDSNWSKAYALVRKSEGGNDDDPLDRGGRTSRGITQREYNAWRAEHGLPGRDVWTASEDEIKTIYHDEYWEPEAAPLPVGIDYLVFDLKVTSGPFRAIVSLQRALGVVDDGRIGPVTRRTLAATDPKTVINHFSDVKRQYYRDIVKNNPKQKRFLNGWLNRTNEVQMNALKMVQ